MDVDGEKAAPLAVCNANMSNNREENFSYRIARYPNWFFYFFCSFVIFSNGFYDDAKCNWRWDDYMESSKFFFSEGWQRGIELFEIYGYGKKGGAGFCYLK